MLGVLSLRPLHLLRGATLSLQVCYFVPSLIQLRGSLEDLAVLRRTGFDVERAKRWKQAGQRLPKFEGMFRQFEKEFDDYPFREAFDGLSKIAHSRVQSVYWVVDPLTGRTDLPTFHHEPRMQVCLYLLLSQTGMMLAYLLTEASEPGDATPHEEAAAALILEIESALEALDVEPSSALRALDMSPEFVDFARLSVAG